MTSTRTPLWWPALSAVWMGCAPADKGDGASTDEATTEAVGGADDGGQGTTGSGDVGSGDGGGDSDDGSSTGAGEDDGDGGGDDGSTTGPGDDGSVDLDSLNGDVPDNPQSLPDFVAINSDGAARSREDLLGHPTVMWFYPAAATAG